MCSLQVRLDSWKSYRSSGSFLDTMVKQIYSLSVRLYLVICTLKHSAHWQQASRLLTTLWMHVSDCCLFKCAYMDVYFCKGLRAFQSVRKGRSTRQLINIKYIKRKVDQKNILPKPMSQINTLHCFKNSRQLFHNRLCHRNVFPKNLQNRHYSISTNFAARRLLSRDKSPRKSNLRPFF